MKRAALYVRVSTKEQREHGLSVDSQITALKEYCEKNGYTVASIYNDAGISASKKYKRRPALIRLIDDCSNGLVDIVLFTKLDRFFRNVPDYYECIAKMHEVPWAAIWEDYETETSSGKFKVNIMLSIAQAEAERTSERIKAVNDYRRAQGKYIGKAPAGYRLEHSHLVIDESARDAVAEFFRVFDTTGVIAEARAAMLSAGVNVSKSTAKAMLINETYAGTTSTGYKCEAYITREQFERNRTIANRRAGSNCKRVYMFSGLLRCGVCGGAMDGSAKHYRGNVAKTYKCRSHYQNNVCTCTTTFFETKIERYLLASLDEELSKYTVITAAKANGKDRSKERKALEAKLERVGQRFEDGDITVEEYRRKRDKIKADLASLPKEFNLNTPPVLPNNWLKVYGLLTTENRKNFWHGILKYIYIVKDGQDYVLNLEFV